MHRVQEHIFACAFQIITKMASDTGFPEFGKEVRKLFMLRDGVCLNHGSYGCVPREVHEEQIRYIIQKYGHDTCTRVATQYPFQNSLTFH